MRRFEFSDGASSKFWEIGQDEAELQIRWGRIGTQGQSQTKSFADAAKARAALDKLIAEKTGKGYAEVGAVANVAIAIFVKDKDIQNSFMARTAVPHDAAVTTKAAVSADATDALPPLPSASAALPPWLAAGEALDFDAAWKRVHRATIYGPQTVPLPSRRFPAERAEVDSRIYWRLARERLFKGIVLNAAATEPALWPLLQQTWQRLDTMGAAGSDESDALLLALSCALLNDNSAPTYADLCFAEYLIASRGLVAALQLLLQAQAYHVVSTTEWRGHPSCLSHEVGVTHSVSSPLSAVWHSPLSENELAFRRHLSHADEAAWCECVALVKAQIGALHPARQAVVAMLFPDAPEISNAVALRIAGAAAPEALHWLQLTASSPEALEAVFDCKPGYQPFLRNASMVATVLRERRGDILPLLRRAPADDLSGDLLCCFGVPEAIAALASVAATNKSCLLRLNHAVQRWPLPAIAALAGLIATGERESALLAPLLDGLLLSNTAAQALLRPWLDAATNAVIERRSALLAGPADVAVTEDLPAVLADPPWLKPRKTKAHIADLVPLELPTQLLWREGERERWSTLPSATQRYFEQCRDDMRKFAKAFGSDIGLDATDPVGEQQLLELREVALLQQDAEALYAVWLRAKADRPWRRLVVKGGLIAQLPQDFALAVWNRFAGEDEGRTEDVAYMLARFGLAAWPGAQRVIRRNPIEFAELVASIADVELAPTAARAFAKLKTLRGFGRDWLLRCPGHAAAALVAPALGKTGEARECAGAALRFLAANGHASLIHAVAARYGRDEVTAAVCLMLAEDPLDRFPDRRGSLPAFWAPRGWRRPRLRSSGKALADAALDHLGAMLMFPANEERYAGIAQVKDACTPESLADFSWDLFNAWLVAAGSPKDSWGMAALGWLGNDDTARRLTPLIRNWPGEGAHARAVAGLDVLAAIGSDVALMLLNGIAQKVKFKGLQDKAREKIEAIATARDLSTEELEDRLAPDLGLDESGTLLLDFGPRQFRVGFDETLKPCVRDGDGARRADLPKPTKADDAALAAAAVANFKRLGKDARTIAAQQILRLEIAMCARRRWECEVFERFLAGHPLLRHLVQRLVWGVYEVDEDAAAQGGRLSRCFRVAEDGSYCDTGDATIELPQGDHIRLGLPHALELPAETAAAFAQVLADYELLQPFAQLGRESFTLTEAERAATVLVRWKNKVVPTGRILGLVNKGWRRGAAQDGGSIWYFTKPLSRRTVIELSFEPGIIVGLVGEHPEQVLLDLRVGVPGDWGGVQQAEPFSTLDAIAASEMIRDLEALCA
ncbi:MAG: DUF4132 domain-containing protein [Rhodanobacteraceae bacterium]|nr:DUF4132 domain-containing protein [Rhodanobacteraceae bacterium]